MGGIAGFEEVCYSVQKSCKSRGIVSQSGTGVGSKWGSVCSGTGTQGRISRGPGVVRAVSGVVLEWLLVPSDQLIATVRHFIFPSIEKSLTFGCRLPFTSGLRLCQILPPPEIPKVGETMEAQSALDDMESLEEIHRYLTFHQAPTMEKDSWFSPVKHIASIIRANCQNAVKLSSWVAVDEAMIAFTGRSRHKFNIPSKPTPDVTG